MRRVDGTFIDTAEIQGIRARTARGYPCVPSAREKQRPCQAKSQVDANFYGAPPRCVFCGVSRLLHELRERD